MKGCSLRNTLRSTLAVFMLLGIQSAACASSPKGGQCNIVLITIDTLRADHLSCYGYHRKTSPAIDGIAAKGILCKNVFAPSSWTMPSMISLFTSVYPVNHGAVHGVGLTKNRRKFVSEVFSPDLMTLAEVLKAHGYTTFGVSAHAKLSEQSGFHLGFDYFTCLPYPPAQEVNEAVFNLEAAIKKAGKFFLWIHYFDPHGPYIAQMPWAREYALQARTEVLLDLPRYSIADLVNLLHPLPSDAMTEHQQRQSSDMMDLLENIKNFTINPEDHSIALYDSEINCVDAHIGMIMKRFNLYDDTLVVITADHGEEFLEHGATGHGHNLYQESIHVPLVVKLPRSRKGAVLDRHLSLIDVMPSILEIVDIESPPEILGTSFRKKQDLLSRLKKRFAGSDKYCCYSELDGTQTLKAVLMPPWKYIHNYRNDTGQLYNIAADPQEKHNVAGESTWKRDQLKDQLQHWVETSKRYSITKYDYELSPQEEEKLKGLGYL